MKRFLTIFTMMFIGFTLWADNNEPLESRKEILVVGSTQHTDIMRDISYNVSAYINYDSDLLELECYGIGDADIYIVDSNNQVIDQIIVFDGTPTSYIPVPEEHGNYVLVIWSEKYYGEGFFTI
jgi:hypothetical protein